MASLRRSNRARTSNVSGGPGDEDDEQTTSPAPQQRPDENGTASSSTTNSATREHEPPRKRKRDSNEARTASPEPSADETHEADASVVNGDGTKDAAAEGSSIKTRSSPRKIVVVKGASAAASGESAGPPTKVQRGESTEQANGAKAADRPPKPVHYQLKIESDEDDQDQRDVAVDQEADEELKMSAEDKKKLNVVIRAFAPELLKMRLQPAHPVSSTAASSSAAPNGSTDDTRRRGAAERRARSTETLDDLLSMNDINIGKLRKHLVKLQSPLITPGALRAHLSGSHIMPSRESVELDRRKLAAITTCLTLVDEIAGRMRTQGLQSIAKDSSTPKRKAEGEYALHMRLPIGDFFTNAVTLSDQEAVDLDTACADLVATSTSTVAPQADAHVPTLGERLRTNLANRPVDRRAMLGPHHRRRRDEDEYAKPVSHLYYGPWMTSFAPTYDSFDGQLSYDESCALWRSKVREARTLRRWADDKPTVSSADARRQLEDDIEDLQDDLSEDLDVDGILSVYDTLPDVEPARTSLGIDEALQRNARLLGWLQELQEQRWRQSMAQDALAKGPKPGSEKKETLFAKPDDNEKAIAHELLDSLTHLLSSRPRKASAAESRSVLIPDDKVLHAVSSSAAIDPALFNERGAAGFWGTLDDTTYGPSATRRITSRATPAGPNQRSFAAIRDAETMRLPSGDAEEKVSLTTAAAANVPRSNEGRGKGLLERFADSRSYTFENDVHDRKPPVPPAPNNAAKPGSLPHAHARASPQSGLQARPAGKGGVPSTQSLLARQPSFGAPGATPPRPGFNGAQPTMSYARPAAGVAPRWSGAPPQRPFTASPGLARPAPHTFRPPMQQS